MNDRLDKTGGLNVNRLGFRRDNSGRFYPVFKTRSRFNPIFSLYNYTILFFKSVKKLIFFFDTRVSNNNSFRGSSADRH